MNGVIERTPVTPDAARSSPTVVQPRAPAALLVITDDPELRDLLMELAIEEGYGIRCVSTEVEAAAAVHLERPGVLVADLDMPTRVAGKFLRTLRRSPYQDIACMAVTASNDTMLSVSLDAPVFYKPALDGFTDALTRLFGQPR
jgi:CheY-like chemotaxis protein